MHLLAPALPLDRDRWAGLDRQVSRFYRLGRRPLEIALVAVELFLEEEEEVSLAAARREHPCWSKGVVKALSFRWAHWMTTVEGCVADAAAAATAAAAAVTAAVTAAAAWRCEFGERLVEVGEFWDPVVVQEEEEKEELHHLDPPHHGHHLPLP